MTEHESTPKDGAQTQPFPSQMISVPLNQVPNLSPIQRQDFEKYEPDLARKSTPSVSFPVPETLPSKPAKKRRPDGSVVHIPSQPSLPFLHDSENGSENEDQKHHRSTAARRLWSESEDEAIVELVKKFGTKRWALIAQMLKEEYKIRDRTGKQCRER